MVSRASSRARKRTNDSQLEFFTLTFRGLEATRPGGPSGTELAPGAEGGKTEGAPAAAEEGQKEQEQAAPGESGSSITLDTTNFTRPHLQPVLPEASEEE